MLFTEKCLSCANANQMCCTICGVGRNGEREKYKQKPRTNADRIRSMTDEEMARFLWQVAPYDNCPPVNCIEFETLKKPTTDECIACWGRWLRQEVEG